MLAKRLRQRILTSDCNMIIITCPSGREHRIAEGAEYIMRELCPDGSGEISSEIGSDVRQLDALLADGGIRWGDAVERLAAPIAALIGVSKCTPCQVRKTILNAQRALCARHGKVRGLILISKLIKRSLSEPAETVMKELSDALSNS